MMIDDFLKKHELKVIFSSELKVDQETFVKKMKEVTDINFITIFFLVADNFLFGKGFGWHTYYLSEHELHPVLQGFESIITVAISDGGFCGLILWSYLFYISYKYSSLKDKKKKYYKIFTFVQLTIAIATGFSYFFFYGMYIVLLNRFYLLRDKGQ